MTPLPWDAAVADLPRVTAVQLFGRLRMAGLHLRRWPDRLRMPYCMDFHGDGCGLHRGILWWSRPDRAAWKHTPVDTLTHEAGHALLLPGVMVSSWRSRDFEDHPANPEHLVMIFQVEVVRGIPGLGVKWALEAMTRIGYAFPEKDGEEVTASTWWRSAWRDLAVQERARMLAIMPWLDRKELAGAMAEAFGK